jgi:SAM-dependent methyltransferase
LDGVVTIAVVPDTETPWYQDSQFWEDFAPVLFDGYRIRNTPVEIDKVLARTGLESGAFLDLCCGPGRHSLELARRGFAVTGVDITSGYVEQARRTAADEGLAAEFVEADVREFRRPGAFDGAISMFSSFGYFDELRDDRRVLSNAAESLRPGGVLLIETMGKETVARNLRRRHWYSPADKPGTLFLVENTIIGAWERVELHWIVVRPDGSRAEARLLIRLYSALEMASLLRDAGFSSVEVHGDLEGSAYGLDASLLVAVARK